MEITGWMVHAWVVPGWESPAGVFSHENPNLRCADGTYNTDAVGKCEGIWIPDSDLGGNGGSE